MLKTAVSSRKPHVVVVTGDIANHPSCASLFGKGPWKEAREWLDGIKGTGSDVAVILVLPGNHDVLFSGLVGWCWLPTLLFRRAFKGWVAPAVRYMPGANVTFLTLDTNPVGTLFSAEGKAQAWRIKRLKRALHEHPQAAEIRASTKILLIHHHPLPVPFDSSEILLSTRRVDRLLRFMAEERVDLVLHGHRHRGSWSHLRIGGTSEDPSFVEALGAGSSMKGNDYDRRGHNFNMIDVAPNGVRQIRQFFKLGAQADFMEAPHSPAEKAVTRLVQFQFRQPYRARRLTWRVQVDPQGDGRNTLLFDDVVFNRPLASYEIPLFEDDVEGGQGLPYRDLIVTPPTLNGALTTRQVNGRPRTAITFTQQPTEGAPATVTVENYTLNAYALNQQEAEAQGRTDTARDYLDLTLTDPVDELCLEAILPSGFVVANPRLEVYEPLESADIVHQPWTLQLGQTVIVTGNKLSVALKEPPPNFRYHISWDLPPHGIEPAAHARQAIFEQAYLGLATSGASSAQSQLMEEAIINAFQDLLSALEHFIAMTVGASGKIQLGNPDADFSMMVRCISAKGPPKLRLVYWSRETDHPEAFRGFRLGIGEGNAGRAYKASTLRLYDRAQADANPQANTFRENDGGPSYVSVLSMPLVDSRSPLPLAVLNFASCDPHHAALMRPLTLDHFKQLTTRMHGSPLQGLLQAAGLAV